MDSKTCIFMEDKKTVITNFHVSKTRRIVLGCLVDVVLSKNAFFFLQAPGASGEDKKDFTFDYSYWSADSSDKHYASQEQVCFTDKSSMENVTMLYKASIFLCGL